MQEQELRANLQLTEKIRHLEEQNAQLRAQLGDNFQQNVDAVVLEDRIEDATNLIGTLERKLAEQSAEIGELTMQLDAAQTECASLRANSAEDHSSCVKRYENVKADNALMRKRIESLEQQLNGQPAAQPTAQAAPAQSAQSFMSTTQRQPLQDFDNLR